MGIRQLPHPSNRRQLGAINMTSCLICNHRQNTEHLACPRCTYRMRDDLSLIANYWLVATTDPTLTPRGTPGSGTSNPLPGGTSWISYRQGSDINGPRGILTHWATDWAATLDTTTPPSSIESLCHWFTKHLPTAVQRHPDIDLFAEDLAKLARTAKYHAGQSDPLTIPVQCTNLISGKQECGNPIRITTNDTSNLSKVIKCGRCRAKRSVLQILKLAAYEAKTSPDIWVDIEWASRLLKVSEATIYRWAQQGRIKTKNATYNIASVQDNQKAANE